VIEGTSPNSKLVSIVLLYFWHHSDHFVHSFQTSIRMSIRKGYNTNGFFRSTGVSLGGLPQREKITDVGGVDMNDDQYFVDQKDLNSDSNTNSVSNPDQPDYCYVDLDNISIPFVSREDSESVFIEYTDDGLCLPAGPVGQLKEVVANFLNEPSAEISIALVVLLNSFLVALSTLDSLSYLLPNFRNAEIVIGSIFFADFVARWFSSSRDQLGFVLDPQFAVDILVVILPLVVSITPDWMWHEVKILPSAVSQPSGLFNLQLLRVLRLRRFLRDLDAFERFAEQALGRTNVDRYIVQDWQLQLARIVLLLFTLISVATGLIYTAENRLNPNIDNYFDALYFGLTTLTTVGFGDVTPVTSQGRLIVCGSIVAGVAVIPAQTAALLEALLDREDIKNGRTGNNAFRQARNPQNATIELTENSANSPEADRLLALDTIMTCSRCGASFHWSCARYCYRCGGKIKESR